VRPRGEVRPDRSSYDHHRFARGSVTYLSRGESERESAGKAMLRKERSSPAVVIENMPSLLLYQEVLLRLNLLNWGKRWGEARRVALGSLARRSPVLLVSRVPDFPSLGKIFRFTKK